jgi:hypothetical protein
MGNKITVSSDQEFTLLEPQDRCDSCGAQAYVLVIFPDDKALTFCGHHWKKHSAKLIELAVDVVDETDKLSPKQETPDE